MTSAFKISAIPLIFNNALVSLFLDGLVAVRFEEVVRVNRHWPESSPLRQLGARK